MLHHSFQQQPSLHKLPYMALINILKEQTHSDKSQLHPPCKLAQSEKQIYKAVPFEQQDVPSSVKSQVCIMVHLYLHLDKLLHDTELPPDQNTYVNLVYLPEI